MKQVDEFLYKKIVKLSDEVKSNFKRKGIAIPSKNNDGSITLGRFTICKKDDSFYCVTDQHGDVIVDQINLPQTAAIVANGLALGKWIDDKIIAVDRTYGYALFEETLYKHHAENIKGKNLDRLQMMLIKGSVSRAKKESCKRDILNSFQNLMKFI